MPLLSRLSFGLTQRPQADSLCPKEYNIIREFYSVVFAVILVFHHLFHYTQTLTEIHPTVKTGDFFRRRVKSQHEQRLDWAGRNVFTYSGEITGTPNGDAPSILNTSYNFKAEVEVPTGGGEIIKFRSVLMASLIS